MRLKDLLGCGKNSKQIGRLPDVGRANSFHDLDNLELNRRVRVYY